MYSSKEVTLIESFPLASDMTGLRFKGHDLEPHIPGQFYIVSINGTDGNITSREYSLANQPNTDSILEFGVQKIPEGVVSNYLCSLEQNATITVKGPMGMYFNWNNTHQGPVVFIAGGAGLVPFMSMIRTCPANQMILLGSFKTIKHIPYYEELIRLQKDNKKYLFDLSLTQDNNSEWEGRRGRINLEYLRRYKETLLNGDTQIFICGRSTFVEDMNDLLTALDVHQERIQRERFG